MAETIALPLNEIKAFVRETEALVAAVFFDECGAVVAGRYVGGNGGLLQRETLKANDDVRRRLGAIATLIADYQAKQGAS
ncbi:MAG TPA: hypothetical protein VNS12_02380 [Pelagibacterium sp.]|uniref:hypothetical protein n=1 Tax=Pelagibacterium sp. TaxID=1967288 RepID=UPI002C114C8B|nr:hypothetical protein [Pelagibacterium sp.]HWJ86899.1 hypothetical protein [Pelagibacterium sp.]